MAQKATAQESWLATRANSEAGWGNGDATRIRDYFELYMTGGIEKVKEVTFHRPKSEMEAYTTTLEAHFRANPPATIVLSQTNTTHKTALDSLITLRFQLFEKAQFLPV
ncbi:MAG: hypothetical protein M1434_14355 [Chloroflexi bacterium]|nr:hypothetical protein [Chloroflexota bacterium]MCL5275901.1 hypothetical protein [Chloroflexota bacterium]